MEIFPINPTISQEEISAAKERFLHEGYIDDDVVRPIVAESWNRSKKLGLNPDQSVTVMLPKDQYLKKIEENRPLIEAARPIIQELFLVVDEPKIIYTLTSRDGYSLLRVGRKSVFQEIIRQHRISESICFCEGSIGTSGFALAQRYKAVVQICGAEYYTKRLVPQHVGTYVGLYGHDGAFMSVIGILFLDRHHNNRLLIGLVKSLALAIEKQMADDLNQGEQDVLIEKNKTIFNNKILAVLYLNPRGEIEQINQRAAQLIGPRPEGLVGRSINEIFRENPNLPVDRLSSLQGGWFSDQQFTLIDRCSGETKNFLVEICPVRTRRNELSGSYLFLQEIGQGPQPYRKKMLIKSQDQFPARYTLKDFIGRNEAILKIKKLIKSISTLHSTVLLGGETGTGKEILAHAVHHESQRRKAPFIAINCSSIPGELFESILFGYDKGSFTGAKNTGNMGKFELAHRGTLFLDEIGDLPLALQPKLLRVLSTGQIERLGSNIALEIDVRLIASTNKNLSDEVRRGNFRDDLFYRLNVVNIFIPPLKERKDDIPLLVDYFVHRLCRQLGTRIRKIEQDFYDVLNWHDWPGNVRELENIIERAIIYSSSNVLTAASVEWFFDERQDHDADRLSPMLKPAKTPPFTLKDTERDLILRTLERLSYNKSKTARSLGISRETLRRKLDLYKREAELKIS